jgi:hypothetical protein
MEKEDINICKNKCTQFHSLDGLLIRCLHLGIICQFNIINCLVYQRLIKENK